MSLPATPHVSLWRQATSNATSVGPSHDEIASRAYALHVNRSPTHGCPMEDWVEAERQLNSERGAIIAVGNSDG